MVLMSSAAAVMTVAILSVLALHNNQHFQNFIFHTQDNSAVATSSNEGHASAFRQGIEDLETDPLGQGPGTAGPASVYNNHQPRIAENYYIQLAQEAGIPGLLLFVAIVVVVGYLLWTRRETTLALSLFAALVGISVVNLFSHAWTDDTLAYIWWGLAGLAVGTPVLKKVSNEKAK
jgi:O-antigen ligase